ncbi:hypothetical protein MUG91_G383n8 [Manis pentadactyla]|nr:hypothetical protein MUG91_G383n8 [Manis pentadactyla]
MKMVSADELPSPSPVWAGDTEEGGTLSRPLTAVPFKEFQNSQDSPQPEARVVVPDRSQTPGEEPSVSEYFSCVSSPGKLPAAAEDGGGGGGGGIPQWHQDIRRTEPHEVTQPQVLEEREAPFLSTEDPFSPYLGMAGIKIYYRRVQMKRGVAVSWDEVEVLEPASKKSKRQFTVFEDAERKGEEASDIRSRLSTQELLTVSDDSEDPQKREQAGSAVEPPAQEESPRAETPEWLVALDSGFRCLGCCRVFPSLEVLQEHVDSAVREGFSCHVFQHALAWLNKNKKEEDKEEEKEEEEEDQRKTIYTPKNTLAGRYPPANEGQKADHTMQKTKASSCKPKNKEHQSSISTSTAENRKLAGSINY